jgi:hypothetical protein
MALNAHQVVGNAHPTGIEERRVGIAHHRTV